MCLPPSDSLKHSRWWCQAGKSSMEWLLALQGAAHQALKPLGVRSMRAGGACTVNLRACSCACWHKTAWLESSLSPPGLWGIGVQTEEG